MQNKTSRCGTYFLKSNLIAVEFMNVNPFSSTTPHYDSYDDFYKFFEISPKEAEEGIFIKVFPPFKPIPMARKKVAYAEEDC